MKIPHFCRPSLAAILLASSAGSYADDFSQAAAKINKIKPDISYGSFCSSTPSGEDKMACQLKSIPTIGLLVCQKADYSEDKSCEALITEEITNLSNVKKAGLATVDFRTDILTPLNCAREKSKECAGYLVSWVNQSEFVNIDDEINAGHIPELASSIRSFSTSSASLAKTRADLKKIADFMTPDAGKFSRICDLQGFYLRGGGFLINDVPDLKIKETTAPGCWDDMPSWRQALDGINQLVGLLK
ncbi:hypothetical protein DDT52_17220 [Brenneria roseae subsp. roseae]|uniref:hypothetical protein n=1 Tax=Brenneria roseae TaxID=1509241 RepID=UPI000D618F72|nr:hypothetical protein [Brenneria roseae]PWC17025.1 hypothetical protein DDT52_17220 [Brenneria roseae subsp. roseae]